jgi:hypothetical protein
MVIVNILQKPTLVKLNTFPNFETPSKIAHRNFFFVPFERLILIFSAIFWYCMITRQLIVKKNVDLLRPK